MNKLLGYAVVAIAAIALSGCATSRSTIMPKLPVATNPASGPAVKIVSVVDQRVFDLKPRDPSTPSLGSAAEIANTALTSHTIGRKRNGYGMAMGDVQLPENKTVAALIEDAVAGAYRQAGFRVLAKTDEGYDSATPVDVKVKQFWCWDTPGLVQMSIENKIETVITAPQPGFESGATVNGYAIDYHAAVFESAWTDITTASLADFDKNLRAKLKP